MWHRCNLAGKESGLECACVNNDDFTVLVSGGGSAVEWVCVLCGHCIQNDWVSTVTSLHQISPWKLFGWFRRPELWATGDWQLRPENVPAHACIMFCVGLFGETSNHPSDLALLLPRFGAWWLLAFPKTEITLEREEISDCPWDSGKYNWEADGDWENWVRSQGAYFEGDWSIIVLHAMFLVLYLLQ